MASGSYAKKPAPQASLEIQIQVPQRATRQLPRLVNEEEEAETETLSLRPNVTHALQAVPPMEQPMLSGRLTTELKPRPVQRHFHWLKPLITCIVIAVLFSVTLLWSAIFQRPSASHMVDYFGGQSYSVELVNAMSSNRPLPPKVPLQTGPYSVLGKPTINADFINQVLDSYHSPAAGKGQALYDLGIKYDIDPAFALAFFMQESTLGIFGEARKTLSLGNLRCMPDVDCIDRDLGGYAAFPSWEVGFEAWYKLIRNLYVAQWGLTTIDQIIHRFAPNLDRNNETSYINILKHCVDTWHAGQLRP